jgi:hypothetical protein
MRTCLGLFCKNPRKACGARCRLPNRSRAAYAPHAEASAPKALGLTIPETLPATADEVIQ